MNRNDIKSLNADTHWKEIAEFMSKYNLINVPIVDEKSKLLGVVSVDDVLPWLLDE
jgi:Mg/Co/Ni transporter MgtE